MSTFGLRESAYLGPFELYSMVACKMSLAFRSLDVRLLIGMLRKRLFYMEYDTIGSLILGRFYGLLKIF